jgi:FkbM family methyltransferase
MQPEKMIIDQIPYLLAKYDKKKLGVAIDVGVGTFNYYFETFHNSGFKTFAIEPLPTESLRKVISSKKIHLIEACILDYEGRVSIYSGIFNDSACIDVSSIHKDWWGINEKSSKTEVASITLETLIRRHQISAISYIKIDTEGSEYLIIKQFSDLKKSLLPQIIEFEYGGGATKNTKRGGWALNYFEKTLKCINTCHELGYKHLLLFESVNEEPIEINLDELKTYEDIFEDHYVYGNIIMLKEKLYSLDKVKKAKHTWMKNILSKL